MEMNCTFISIVYKKIRNYDIFIFQMIIKYVLKNAYKGCKIVYTISKINYKYNKN